MRAVFFDAAAAATLRISSISRSRRLNGATSSLRNFSGRPKPGHVVEEVRDVLGDVRVGGEQAEVLVERGPSPSGSCPCRCGRSAGGRPARGGSRASPLRGSSCSGSRRRRGRPHAPAPATTRCSAARRSGPSAPRGRRSACRPRPPRSAPARAASRRSSGTRSPSARSRPGRPPLRGRRPRSWSRTSRTDGGRGCRPSRSPRRSSLGPPAKRGCVTGTHGSSFSSGRSSEASCIASARSSSPSTR